MRMYLVIDIVRYLTILFRRLFGKPGTPPSEMAWWQYWSPNYDAARTVYSFGTSTSLKVPLRSLRDTLILSQTSSGVNYHTATTTSTNLCRGGKTNILDSGPLKRKLYKPLPGSNIQNRFHVSQVPFHRHWVRPFLRLLLPLLQVLGWCCRRWIELWMHCHQQRTTQHQWKNQKYHRNRSKVQQQTGKWDQRDQKTWNSQKNHSLFSIPNHLTVRHQ